MEKNFSPLFSAGIALLLLPSLLLAEMRVELIELPPDPADSPAAEEESPSNQCLSTLSERFAGTGLGRHFVRISPEKPFNSSGETILLTDPALLSRLSPAETHVVVDLGKQRLYLMLGHRIALESEACVHQLGQVTPTGFYSMADRIRNGSIAEGVRTWAPYWMRLGSTDFGLHGGPLYGYAAAGGCVRLPLPAAEILFEKTQEGTPVAIFDSWSRGTYTPPPQPAALPSTAAQPAIPPVPPALQAEQAPLPLPQLAATEREPAAQSQLPHPAPLNQLRPVSGALSEAKEPALPAQPPVPPSRGIGSVPPSRSQATDSQASPPSHSATSKPFSAGAPPPAARTPEAPEIARLRTLFQKEKATPPAAASRTPLFPSERQMKRVEVPPVRLEKRAPPATVAPPAEKKEPAPGAPTTVRIRNLFGDHKEN